MKANSAEAVLNSRTLNLVISVLLACLWLFFAIAHYRNYQLSGELSNLLFATSETITIGFYLFRKAPQSISFDLVDWIVAILGTFAPVFLRPAQYGLAPSAAVLIPFGISIQILGLLSLNRSFALVAAKREIKTNWMYRIVRHPIYASYCITITSYLLVNTSDNNAMLYSIFILSLLPRIIREERHLSLDAAYRQYMRKVRYRLIPYVF